MGDSALRNRSVAIIGSFKQHNDEVQRVCTALRDAGIRITSPRGDELVKPGIDFVRFHTDNPRWSDPAIQCLALHRILKADLVYVVVPGGYIGRTTCYEVGRIIQSRRPIYFSEMPLDLPLRVPEQYILDMVALVARVADNAWYPSWLFENDLDHTSALERDLMEGRFRDE